MGNREPEWNILPDLQPSSHAHCSSYGALSVTNPGKGDNVHSQVIFLDRQKIPNTNGVYFK